LTDSAKSIIYGIYWKQSHLTVITVKISRKMERCKNVFIK